MREYDEMSTGGFWERRERQMRQQAREDSDYAASPLGKLDAARKLCSYLGTKRMDQNLSEEEKQQYAEARKLLGIK